MAADAVVDVVVRYKGIKCPNPNCGSLDNYKGGQNLKTTDCVTRRKECKNCGTVFTTVEVPVKVVEIKNNHTTQ